MLILRGDLQCAQGTLFSSWSSEDGLKVTINGQLYRAMIKDFFVPELDDVEVDDFRFQQGTGTCCVYLRFF